MADFSIAQVAGVIAVVVFVVQLCIPIVLGVLLAGILQPQHNLTTWSVVSRFLHSSYWPNILGSDSVASHTVHRPILTIVWSRPLILGLLGIAAVVTPLGLYESVDLDGARHFEQFHYALDETPMGYGTPDRGTLGLNRWCGRSSNLPCMGRNITSNNSDYDFTIPESYIRTYEGGLANFDVSVSGVFDIDWRTYSSATHRNGSHSDSTTGNEPRFQIGAYRNIERLILNDDIGVVEGLVVNTRDGGIGFRNHSVPSSHPYGSIWSEDILFIEPQSVCVDTNLTLEFRAKDGLFSSLFSSNVEDLALVDRGGLTALNKLPPVVNKDISIEQSLQTLDLYSRAYQAAWFNNLYTMAFLNVTDPNVDGLQHVNSEIGKRFPLDPNYGPFVQRDAMHTSQILGDYLDLSSKFDNGSLVPKQNLFAPNYSNPFNISSDEFEDIVFACEGTNGMETSATSNVAITCGVMYGTPRRIDGTFTTLFNFGDELMMPIYTCASATRASLKTIHFNYNGTGQLAGLSVERVEDKAYKDAESEPLWGVEITNIRLSQAQPIWGFVQQSDSDSDSNQARRDLVTLRQQSLYLPGYQNKIGPTPYTNEQNLAGVDFHVDAMSMAYGIAPSSMARPYSGSEDLGIFARWQNLSSSADTASKILNLVWTDVAANAVVGTKGWHTSAQEEVLGSSQGGTHIQRFNRGVRYHWLYGIPAYLVLAITLATAVVSVIFYITGRARSSTVRWYLNATSMGRVYGQFMKRDIASVQLPTDDWICQVGVERVRIGGEAQNQNPRATVVVEQPSK
ncbi:uncharacterized protein BDV17DRAFT_288970 [Aspergillus undulatus]|uniref:uncharacterized protein n=1 Tax=Aspergillus undulatus TaxID=1810928 RepID=UPI003CCE28AC